MVVEFEQQIRQPLKQERPEPVLKYIRGCFRNCDPVCIDRFRELMGEKELPVSVLKRIQRLSRRAEEILDDDISIHSWHLIALEANRRLAR